nr:hypothetical protein [Rhizobium sp. BK275]
MLGAAYTVYEDRQTRFDVLAGARYWHAETTISLNGGLIGGLSRSDEGNWVDGFAGVKGRYSFTDTVFCLLREDAPALIVAILHERMDLMTRLAGRLNE